MKQKCIMCEIRAVLKKAMDEVGALPEINSPLYDDTVIDAYRALEIAYIMHKHYCDEQQTHNMKCAVCGVDFETDGYTWTCSSCRHPERECECGSDDVTLDWHIIFTRNGELCPDPAWAVVCHWCERQTPYFETAKEAAEYWAEHGGLFFMENGEAE